jgi:dienelactone hydrolase
VRHALAALVLLMTTPAALAAVQGKDVTYKRGDTELRGYVTWDDSWKDKRPGVLVVHEWWGHNEHARRQARRLAKEGYVGFALDMFGEGKVTTHPEDAQAFVAEATKDMAVMQGRFEAGLAQLKADEHVDPERIAAIGYCFGGGVALNMARLGADLDAVVTFHASLGTDTKAAGPIRPRILVLTGGADPMVPPSAIATFEEEMKAAGANARVVTLPGAKHGFTNPDADKAGIPALGYSAKADRKSWKQAMALLHEVFGR